MKTNLTGAALFADSLRLTLQLSESANPFAAFRSPRTPVRAREITWRGRSESPFRPRDPAASRRLLIAPAA